MTRRSGRALRARPARFKDSPSKPLAALDTGFALCFHILSRWPGATEFRYRLYGSVLASYYDRDLTGKLTEVLPPETRDTVRREYAELCAVRRCPR